MLMAVATTRRLEEVVDVHVCHVFFVRRVEDSSSGHDIIVRTKGVLLMESGTPRSIIAFATIARFAFSLLHCCARF